MFKKRRKFIKESVVSVKISPENFTNTNMPKKADTTDLSVLASPVYFRSHNESLAHKSSAYIHLVRSVGTWSMAQAS